MKLRPTLLALTAAALPLSLVGIASATAPSGVSPTPHVLGAQLGAVKTNADGVKLQTKGPTDVSVLTLTLGPGGTTGWHTHPGVAIVSVAEGAGRLHAADCTSTAYRAGQSFVETGDDAATVFRNEGTEDVVLTVAFLAPRGAAIIEDRPDPGCGIA